jgi:predicted nucleic acid-binding protein
MDIDLPEGSIVLLDSSALVYLVEGEPGSPRRRAVEAFLAEAASRGIRLAASTLVWAELLEKPLASGLPELATRYRSLLSDSSRIELRVVDVAVAEGAAALSASLAPALRRALSEADLVQVATARLLGALAVLGNDEAWRGVPGCPRLILVDELAFEEA